jgi:hypothetical protein
MDSGKKLLNKPLHQLRGFYENHGGKKTVAFGRNTPAARSNRRIKRPSIDPSSQQKGGKDRLPPGVVNRHRFKGVVFINFLL